MPKDPSSTTTKASRQALTALVVTGALAALALPSLGSRSLAGLVLALFAAAISSLVAQRMD